TRRIRHDQSDRAGGIIGRDGNPGRDQDCAGDGHEARRKSVHKPGHDPFSPCLPSFCWANYTLPTANKKPDAGKPGARDKTKPNAGVARVRLEPARPETVSRRSIRSVHACAAVDTQPLDLVLNL